VPELGTCERAQWVRQLQYGRWVGAWRSRRAAVGG